MAPKIIKKPGPGDMAVERMRLIYTKAEQNIIKELTRKRNLGLVDYSDLAALERVQKILQDMSDEVEQYAPIAIKEKFYKGGELPSAPYGYANAEALTGTQTAIVERLVDNLLANVEEAATVAYKSAEEYLTVGRLEADKLRNVALEMVAKLEAEGKGWNTIQNQMAADLNAKGITCFVDKAGRQWGLSQYCSMATRTTARQAEVAAALTSDDWDLWQIVSIGTTCPLCSVYEGRVYSKSGNDPDYPPLASAFGKIDIRGGNDLANTYLNIHPNCLVPGGFVLAEGLVAESRRLYRGEVVTLETSRGNKITVTPNHPILTNRGFVAAGMIKEGDKVIETRRKYRRFLGKAPNDIYAPSIVNEVFHTRLKSISSATHAVKGSTVQFHGDGGTDSEVNVILADSLGVNVVDTLRGEPRGKNCFPPAHRRRIKLLTESAFFKILKRTLDSLYGSMSGFGFVVARERVTVNGKQLSNLRQRTTANVGNLGVGETLIVKLQKAFKLLLVAFAKGIRYIIKLFTAFGTVAFNSKNPFGVMDVLKRNSEFLSYLPSSEPLLKQRLESLWIDNCIVESTVLHVNTSFYDGYVYNLETEASFYVYNSIVTHNCLHSLVRYTTMGKTDEQIKRDKEFSSFEKRPANADYRSKKQVQAYREKEAARAQYRNDMKQYKKYKAALGNDMPKTFETFEKHKKAGDEVYKGWEEKFRSVNAAAKSVEKTASEVSEILKNRSDSDIMSLEEIVVQRNPLISQTTTTDEIRSMFETVQFDPSFDAMPLAVQAVNLRGSTL